MANSFLESLKVDKAKINHEAALKAAKANAKHSSAVDDGGRERGDSGRCRESGESTPVNTQSQANSQAHSNTQTQAAHSHGAQSHGAHSHGGGH